MAYSRETYRAYLAAKDLAESLLELHVLKMHEENLGEYTIEHMEREVFNKLAKVRSKVKEMDII